MKKLLIILFVLCFCVSAFGQFIPVKMFGQQPCGHFAEGLVFYWRGIEAGNVVDESFFGNHGVITDAEWVGNGLDFDGADSIVNCGSDSSLDDLGPLTISMWVNPRSSGEIAGSLIFKRTATSSLVGTVFKFGASDEAIFTVDYATTDLLRQTSGDFWLPYNVWRNIVVTWDGGITATNIHIYNNGIESSYGTTTNGDGARISDASFDLHIGNEALIRRTFDGIISDVKIYNRALSASEILALYINPDLPMARDPIWLMLSPDVGIDIGVLMRSIREEKTGGKQAKRGGKQ